MYVHFIHLYLKACLYQTHMYTFYLYRAPEEDIFNAKCGKMEIYGHSKRSNFPIKTDLDLLSKTKRPKSRQGDLEYSIFLELILSSTGANPRFIPIYSPRDLEHRNWSAYLSYRRLIWLDTVKLDYYVPAWKGQMQLRAFPRDKYNYLLSHILFIPNARGAKASKA